MTISSVCYEADFFFFRWNVKIVHTEDMNPTALPPVTVFEVTFNGIVVMLDDLLWVGNHILMIHTFAKPVVVPPPKPTVELQIFHRDYRSDFGLVEPVYGPLDLDLCP